MVKTERLKSWFRYCCKVFALVVFLGLNSTPVYSATQTIEKGQTVTGAVGTSSNILHIYGTSDKATIKSGNSGHTLFEEGYANNTLITGGYLFVKKGGTADNTTINSGGLSVTGTINNTTSNGGYLTVYDNASAKNTVINSGGISTSGNPIIDGLTIKEGGNFDFNTGTTLINAKIYGKNVSIIDGVAKDFVLDEDNKLWVSNGDVANNTTVNGGSLRIYNGGTINNTVLNEGLIAAYSGDNKSIISNTTVNNGNLELHSSVVNNTTLNNGTLIITDSSIVNDTIINGGYLNLRDRSEANNTTLNGGSLRVIYGNSANNTIINEGWLYIENGGNANNTTVNNGTIIGYSDSTIDRLTINENGSFDFKTGMTLTNANIYGNDLSIIDGVANDFIINNKSHLSVNSGHIASNTTINNYGSLSIQEGGTANNTILKGGYIYNEGVMDNITLDIKDKEGFIEEYSGSIGDISGSVDNGKLSIYSESGNYINLKNISYKNSSALEVNTTGNLIITADNGISEFSGNRVDSSSGENIAIIGTSDLNLNAKNNGKIIFNDKISTDIKDTFKLQIADFNLSENAYISDINGDYFVNDIYVEHFDTLDEVNDFFGDVEWDENNSFTTTAGEWLVKAYYEEDKETGGYIAYEEGILRLDQISDGYFISFEDFGTEGIYDGENPVKDLDSAKNIVNSMIESEGLLPNWIDDNTCLVNDNGETLKFELAEENGFYVMNVKDGAYLLDKNINIDGDASGEVHFNEQIFAKNVNLQNTNVYFGEKSKIKDYTFNANSGSVINAVIDVGGKLVLEAASIAKDTIVEKGGQLIAKAESMIDGLVAKAESILNVDKDTLLKGDIVVDKLANVSGSSYDFNSLFQNENASSLTVTGGVNEVFVKDEASRLVNEDTTSDKSLTLADGEYSIASVIKEGSTQVAGWDVINIKASESAPSTIVKLESDIELVGSNKEVNIGENAVLDVSGHSPLEITIDGSVTNQGTMDFTIYDNDGEADDVVTIVGDYKASPGALIVLNIEPEKDKADKLVIQGDVIGNTNVFLKSNSEASTEAKILFAEVANDKEETASSFDIWRVEGSPFVWKSKKEENNWYTYIDGLPVEPERPTDTSGVRKVVPEMMAYMGLYEAGFEQTSGLSRVVSNQVAKNQMIGRNCINKVCQKIEPVRSAWVSPVNQNIDVKAPYKYEAKINGLDVGIDMESDGINKWGVLASYRKGNYEFDGRGEKYYSEKGSELDIDSYGMGLYFRRDKYNTKFAGMIYAGLQKAEISSDDGVKAKTDALEIGASLDVSHIYEIVKDLTIAPELQISYQMLDYDNIKDNAGKKVQLEASHRLSVEVGAKVEKKWKLDEGKAAIYVKPSVIQTIHGGGKLNVSGLDGIHTTEDRTLGRFEVGAEYDINSKWSVGATAAHTFGADYKDTTLTLDAKYRF